ncbi:MazG-like family protein [Kitasatospora sp. CM 4170]|uniref:MazG-like family protein n=1 Tax=Kitasatospora aburaviensis TaxID=67265 RepID=A0ABW1EZF7_9ACTN|nr:MazG-like family protein [Kitasatospora sp. CM 4170]WNM47293.1 MazG-like family protein [Kitasatospora sp. CM 4170]
MDSRIWESVDHVVAWLDDESRLSPGEERMLRILKLSEEVGEVGAAVIGATGQNPRKGVTHTWEDVQHELCDVVFSALVALRTLTPDAARVFADRLAFVEQRSAASRTAPPNPAGPADHTSQTGPAGAAADQADQAGPPEPDGPAGT